MLNRKGAFIMGINGTTLPGIALCFLLALPCWYLGQLVPLVGGPIFAIILGIILRDHHEHLVSY